MKKVEEVTLSLGVKKCGVNLRAVRRPHLQQTTQWWIGFLHWVRSRTHSPHTNSQIHKDWWVIFQIFLGLIEDNNNCLWTCISNLIILQDCVSPHRAHEARGNSSAVSGEAGSFTAYTATGIIPSETCAEDPEIPSLASGVNSYWLFLLFNKCWM
jgi:hypothetical protein